MRLRLLSGAVLVAGLAAVFAGCPEQNWETTEYPDGWWLAGIDAGTPDGGPTTDAAVWVAVPPPSGETGFTLNAVAASASTMIAVGDQGKAFTYSTASQLWTSVPTSVTENLKAVTRTPGGTWWIAGSNGTVLQWDGTTAFTPATLPATAATVELNAIAGAGSNVWAVGAAGTRLLSDGFDWTDQTPAASDAGTPADLTGLWSNGSTAWAVDSSGDIFRVSGTTWTLFHGVASKRLNAVWGTSEADFWLVGEGTVRRCTYGTTLSCLDLAAGDALAYTWNAVWGDGSGQVWIGSKENVLLRWNGSAWERPMGFSAASAKDVLGLGGSTAVGTWAVGADVLQRLRP